DGSVLAAHSRRVFVQSLAAQQAGEDVVNDGSVGVEVGDVTADILFLGISQQIKLCLIDAQDDPIWSHPVEWNVSVFKEIGKLGLAAFKGLFGSAPPGDVPEDKD